MSKYLLNKFLYTIDRDPELVERYRADPRGTVAWWEADEREALAAHDYVTLFEMGAHNFLTLTLFIALFERDYAEPLAFQKEYAARLGHWSVPYPDIST